MNFLYIDQQNSNEVEISIAEAAGRQPGWCYRQESRWTRMQNQKVSHSDLGWCMAIILQNGSALSPRKNRHPKRIWPNKARVRSHQLQILRGLARFLVGAQSLTSRSRRMPIKPKLDDLCLPLLACESDVPRRQLGLVGSINREPGSAAEQHDNQQGDGFHRSIVFRCYFRSKL